MIDIKQRLLEDHAQLERRLQRLGNAVNGNDSSADLGKIWTAFEADLLEHLATEERDLFPIATSEHRAEIEALRGEHQQIRRALAELGLHVELHTLRKPAVDELIEFLRRHAAREDHSLYDWAERKDGSLSWRSLFAMFERHAARADATNSHPRAD